MSDTKSIYVLSDSIGETGKNLVQATLGQFKEDVPVVRVPYVQTVEQIEEALNSAKESGSVVCHTFVDETLRSNFEKLAKEKGIDYVDIMGSMLDLISKVATRNDKTEPGSIHKMNASYFQKVHALEFAVKYDDSHESEGIEEADVVLMGISRTSKTPLAMYLAMEGYKVANISLIPEMHLPDSFYDIPAHRIIGLEIDPYQLNDIRHERMKALGITGMTNYADVTRIEEEMDHARHIMKQMGVETINVSNKAIEETANLIMSIVENNKRTYGNKY